MADQSSNKPEETIDRLLWATAQRFGHQGAGESSPQGEMRLTDKPARLSDKSCHAAPELLGAYRAHTLSEDENQLVEWHVARCEICRDALITLGKEAHPELFPSIGSRILHSAIAALVLGPSQVYGRLRKVERKLRKAGGIELDADIEIPCFIFDVSAGPPAIEPIDATRLAGILRMVRENLHGTRGGAVLTASRGLIEPGEGRDPVGPAIDRAFSLEPFIREGAIFIEDALVPTLAPLGFRLRPVPGTALARLVTPVDAREKVPGLGELIFGLVEGALSAFGDGPIDVLVTDPRRDRFQSAEAPPLAQGDALLIDYTVPDECWVYCVLQSDGSFDMPAGMGALRAPGDSGSGLRKLLMDAHSATERPLLLISPSKIETLRLALDQANELEGLDAEARLEALMEILVDQHRIENLMLLHAGTFKHVTTPRRSEPEALKKARLLIEEGSFQQAVDILEAFDESTMDAGAHLEARLLLGKAFRLLSRLEDALKVLEAALDAAESDGFKPLVAEISRELAWCYRVDHQNADALPHVERAISLHHELGDIIAEGRDRLCLAAIHRAESRWEEAYRTYRSILAPARQAGEKKVLGAALHGCGLLCHEFGRFSEAHAHYEECVQLLEEIEDLHGQLKIVEDLGQLALDRKQFEEALAHFERVLALALKVGTPVQQSIAYASLGRALTGLGRYDEARDHFLRAHKGFEEGPAHYQAATWVSLAEMELEAGNPMEASRWLERLPEMGELLFAARWRTALARARCKEALGDRGAEAEYRAGVDLVENEGEPLPRLLRSDFLMISKELYEGWIRQLLRRRADAEILLDAVERSRARAFLDALVETEESLQLNFSEAGPSFSHGSSRPRAVAEIQAQLPEHVSFLVHHSLRDRQLLFFVSRDRVAYQVLPLSQAALSKLAAEVREACHDPGSRFFDPDQAPQRLAQALLEPVRPWLESLSPADVLGIVPHAPLQEVPLHALPWRDSTDRVAPLIAACLVTYAPSLQAFVRWRERKASPNDEVLVLANPRGDLPYAQKEGRVALEELGEGRLLIGKAATADALARYGPRARIILLAVHADRDRRTGSVALRLAPSERVSAQVLEKARGRDDPALEHLYGQVRASWIAEQTLDADLIVASSCLSGAGEMNEVGEGPDLLSWAFLAAGARSVVAAYWRVPDHSTYHVMRCFYHELSHGRSRAEALALAQRDRFLNAAASAGEGPRGLAALGKVETTDASHPYYWAGLFLMGEWTSIKEASE